jgi:DNA helicase INO80
LLSVTGVLRSKRNFPQQLQNHQQQQEPNVLLRIVRFANDATRHATQQQHHQHHQQQQQQEDSAHSTKRRLLSLPLPYRLDVPNDAVAWIEPPPSTALSPLKNGTNAAADDDDEEQQQRRFANIAKVIASAAQNRVRLHVVLSVRAERDFGARARTLARDALTQLQRRERARQEAMRRKKLEERATARAREEEEERLRQHRKLNFLLTQTELYTHFVANKHAPPPVASAGDPDALEAAQRAAAARAAEVRVYDDLAAQAQAADAADGTSTVASAATTATPQQPPAKVQFNEVDARIVAETPQPSLFLGGLKSYQQKGLAWLANLFDQSINGILADEMGLGKTIQSIALLAHLAEKRNVWGPFLVVAPSSTLHNWYQEITKFCPSFTVRPYWGNKQQREVLRRSWKQSALGRKNSPWHVVVTSYQLIVQDEKFFTRLKWQYMVMDEAHFLKNSSSARWKVLLSFKCRNRLLLTGTPIQNNMAELWALLHFIMPTLFDSHAEFADWFSKDIESHATGLNAKLNEHQLHRLHMILKPFMLRRVKRDVENEMARKIEKEVCTIVATFALYSPANL